MRRILLITILAFALMGASDEKPEDKVWDLTGYLKGTPAQIRTSINKEIIRLTISTRRSKADLDEAEHDLANDTQACLQRARARNDYKEYESEMKQAQVDLANARKSGTTRERMQASSRYNHAKSVIEKIEHLALNGDHQLALDQSRINNAQQRISDEQQSLKKSEVWKKQVCDATHASLMLEWPLNTGNTGFLGTVTPKAVQDGSFICEYAAFEEVSQTGEAEGIRTVNGVRHVVTLLVMSSGVKGIQADQPIALDRTFEILASKEIDNDTVYVVRPASNNPADLLWKRMTDPISAEELQPPAEK